MTTILCVLGFALAELVLGAAIILYAHWRDFTRWWDTFTDEWEAHP